MTKTQLEKFANVVLGFYAPEDKKAAEYDMKSKEYSLKLEEVYYQIMSLNVNLDKKTKEEVANNAKQKLIAVYNVYA